MTRLEPIVFLAIGGTDVARSTVAGVPTELLALDGLSITWGRTEPLDQQEPATGTVEVFDPSRRWHRSKEWMGARVDLRWSITVAGVTTTRTFFRGRISKIIPRVVTLAGVRGSLVTLEVTSVVTDVANVVPGPKWTQEALGDRRARVSAAVVAAGITGGVTTRTDWDSRTARTLTVDAQVSIAEHVSILFDSLVERMNYSPDTNGFGMVASRDYQSRRTLGILAADPATAATDRAGQGVYIRARSLSLTGGAGTGLYLNAAETEYPEEAGITRDQSSSLTRIRLRSWVLNTSVSPATEDNTVDERILAGVDELVNGVRAIDVNSGIAHFWATEQLDRWEALIRYQVNGWQLEPISWRGSATGGFEELTQLTALMSGEESNALVFLQGSELPLLGLLPVVGVMGGTLAFVAGHWELEWIPCPVTLVARQHPLAWSEVDDGTTANQVIWSDAPHPRGMHSSVTYEDLAWVGVGYGVNEVGWTGTDYGWDFTP